MIEQTTSRFKMTIIRHGETLENKQNILQGQKDTYLSSVGRQQAELTGKYMRNSHFDYIYTSDLHRTVQTLDEILKQFKSSTLAVVKKDPRLRERCFGVLEGRKRSDWISHNPSSTSKDSVCPEGAENLEEVRYRAVSFFDDLCHRIHNEHASPNSLPPSSSARNISLEAPPNVSLPPHCHFVSSNSSSKPHCCAQLCTSLPVTSPSLPISGLSGPQRIPQSVSCSSISSGRNSYEEGALLPDLSAMKSDNHPLSSSHSLTSCYMPHVLMVSHGGLIRELFRYFIDSCQCSSLGSIKQSVVDNCSISEFLVDVSSSDNNTLNVCVECLQFNVVEHLISVKLK